MPPIHVPYEYPSTVEIQRGLSSDYFPAQKHELLDQLRDQDAPPALLSVLYLLPARRYEGVDEIADVLGSLRLKRENAHPTERIAV